MNYKFIFSIMSVCSILILTSCQNNNSKVSSVFSCNKAELSYELETVYDFKNNFSIQVPKHWNTKLYYDDIQSEIFSADTIKHLSDSYIMDFSSIQNTISIDEKLKQKVHQMIMDNGMVTIDESFHKFKNFTAYAHLGKGTSKGMDLYVFQHYIKVDEEKYILIKTEFYGTTNFDSRFCEALSIIDKIKIKN